MTDWFDQQRTNGESIDPAMVIEAGNVGAILDVIREGAMVSLSTTRDGGAVRIAITNDGKTRAEYFRDFGECATWLAHAHAAVSGQRRAGGRNGTAPPR